MSSEPDPLEGLDVRAIVVTLAEDDDWEPKVDVGDLDEFTAIGILVKALVGLVMAEPEDE